MHRPFGNAFRHIIIDDDHAENALVARVNRHAAANHVALAESLRARHFEAAQRPVQKLALGFNRDARRHLLIEGDDERLAVG